MTRRVIILGDSFTFGHGCSDRIFYYDRASKTWIGNFDCFNGSASEYAWPSLLQNHYPDIKVVNLARPGRCNQAMFRDLADYHTSNTIKSDDIIMFMGTFADRVEVSSESTTIPPSVPMSWCLAQDPGTESSTSKDYKLAKKLYVTYLYNDSIGNNLTVSSLMGAYGYSKAFNADFLWSLAIMASPLGYDLFPGTFNSAIWGTIPQSFKETNLKFITEFDFSGNNDLEFNKSCRAADNHVNDKGHAIYFERQILPVIERLLNKA